MIHSCRRPCYRPALLSPTKRPFGSSIFVAGTAVGGPNAPLLSPIREWWQVVRDGLRDLTTATNNSTTYDLVSSSSLLLFDSDCGICSIAIVPMISHSWRSNRIGAHPEGVRHLVEGAVRLRFKGGRDRQLVVATSEPLADHLLHHLSKVHGVGGDLRGGYMLRCAGYVFYDLPEPMFYRYELVMFLVLRSTRNGKHGREGRLNWCHLRRHNRQHHLGRESFR
nr:hypothetical protein Iba_scaffold29163CG0010 [Ipomoea batatas]